MVHRRVLEVSIIGGVLWGMNAGQDNFFSPGSGDMEGMVATLGGSTPSRGGFVLGQGTWEVGDAHARCRGFGADSGGSVMPRRLFNGVVEKQRQGKGW